MVQSSINNHGAKFHQQPWCNGPRGQLLNSESLSSLQPAKDDVHKQEVYTQDLHLTLKINQTKLDTFHLGRSWVSNERLALLTRKSEIGRSKFHSPIPTIDLVINRTESPQSKSPPDKFPLIHLVVGARGRCWD